MTEAEQLRALPSVDEVMSRLAGLPYPRTLIVTEIRRVLDESRRKIRSGEPLNGLSIEVRVQRDLDALTKPSLRRVINATGVVLHTNLGRAPLGPVDWIPGYSNLEYDLAEGRRGKRDVHTGGLFERLLGAPAIVVNNNAAAVFLALHEMALGGEVIVSRGELIEIGDGFRIPDIMQRSGAVLREVGTTNRTGIGDYRAAITERTRLLMRVHPSNFRMEGFVSRPSLEELVALGRETKIPVYEDLGSGCVVDLRECGIDEPLVSASLEAGVDLVSFSGDKLLGGPQAGVLAGKPELVERVRRNPMFRALRVDKLVYQALEETLRNLLLRNWNAVPSLGMIRQTADQIRGRAERLGLRAELIDGESVIGGGSTPEQSLPTCLIAIRVEDPAELERKLRANDPPVICRIADDQVLIDLRTVFPSEEEELKRALDRCLPLY